MVPNVVGMSQHADGGVMATKPYTSGGAYLDWMTDHCGECRAQPEGAGGRERLSVHRRLLVVPGPAPRRFAGNHRMTRALSGLDRLRDLDELVAQEERRGSEPP